VKFEPPSHPPEDMYCSVTGSDGIRHASYTVVTQPVEQSFQSHLTHSSVVEGAAVRPHTAARSPARPPAVLSPVARKGLLSPPSMRTRPKRAGPASVARSSPAQTCSRDPAGHDEGRSSYFLSAVGPAREGPLPAGSSPWLAAVLRSVRSSRLSLLAAREPQWMPKMEAAAAPFRTPRAPLLT